MEKKTSSREVVVIADKMNLSQTQVRTIIQNYTSYIRAVVEDGKSVRFLRICSFIVDGYEGFQETLAHTSYMLAKGMLISPEVVMGVLLQYEEQILMTLREGSCHVVSGVCKIAFSEDGKVIVRKSPKMGMFVNCRTYLRSSFVRKIEKNRE